MSAKTASHARPAARPLAALALAGAVLLAGCADLAPPEEVRDGVGIVPKERTTPTSRENIPWDGSTAGNANTKPAAAPCQSQDVRVEVNWRRPANDVVVGVLTVLNQGTEVCLLSTSPSVQLLDGAGQVLETTRPPPPKTAVGGATELVLKPTGEAQAELWWSEWCRDNPGPVAVQLRPAKDAQPLTSQPVRVLPPPCTGDAGSVLEAKQFKLPEAEGGVLYADATTLRIKLDLPDTVRSGEDLRYRVNLSNPGRWTVRLEPCPNFRDELQLPEGSLNGREQGWTSQSESWFRLNCASLGGRLSPGDEANFEMITKIPAGTAAGFAQLRWSLEANGRTIREEEQILVE